MFSLEGKKALVTGGGRGIGRAIALAFARQGADVALAARSRDELEAVAGEIRSLGRRAPVHTVDLANTEAAVGMVNKSAHELGSLGQTVQKARGDYPRPGLGGAPCRGTPLDLCPLSSARPCTRPV